MTRKVAARSREVTAINMSTEIVASTTSSAAVAVLSTIVGPQIAIPIDISYHHPRVESSETDVNSSNVLCIPIAVLIPALLFHLGYTSLAVMGMHWMSVEPESESTLF
ncbi:hypothetical protein FISHEDRAFT_74567 [Fistulina hepatica ATCC 64428]|uniref:Uncharacterized protein n=1 Tax=Fistulina hepatica ATCC 64428 TaxID=1128425 RepID=A0A0D7AC00_9AGAR|nr:hypothetical protein FISHEDRAFT_74567 [Fistulina hepatica ATCC 64428]